MFKHTNFIFDMLKKRKNIIVSSFAVLAILTGFASYSSYAAVIFNTSFWYISSSDPYLQNWSDTVSISTDDNWNNFIAITGHRGDGLTSAEGTDALTVLADGETTPLDVIANQSNPNTLIQGGVAEFDGIANPTVALKGDSTADAPHLIIRLNNESCPDTKFISVSYRVRDLDSTSNNAQQQVALQYRVGDTGDYSNVPSVFIPDATEPNAATKETVVFATLPHLVLNQDRTYLRILTTNAVGNDEWVGIDDISVGCFVSTAARANVSGRINGSTGRSRGTTLVSMTDQAGETRTVRTNQFGNYHFDDVAIGGMYIFQVHSKQGSYTPQVIIVSADVQDLDFTPNTENDFQSIVSPMKKE